MKLTKKYVEKKYGVRLVRDSFDMCADYKSWTAYIGDSDIQIAWRYTLAELVEELERKREEIQELTRQTT